MTPRLESAEISSNNGDNNPNKNDTDKNNNNATMIVRQPGKPAWVRCTSQHDFVNPFDINDNSNNSSSSWSAEDKNTRLNLNLGQRVVTPDNKLLVWILRFLNSLTVEWWEAYFFALWKRVPLALRRALTFGAWRFYFPIHKALLGRTTGLHRDASAEYHALTTVMWWGRLFPVSVRRMRFSLSQLHVVAPSPVQSRVVEICDDIRCGLARKVCRG